MKHIVKELDGFSLQPSALSQVIIFNKLILSVWDLTTLLLTLLARQLQTSHATEWSTYSARTVSLSPPKITNCFTSIPVAFHRVVEKICTFSHQKSIKCRPTFHIIQILKSIPPPLLSKDYLLENIAKMLNPACEY